APEVPMLPALTIPTDSPLASVLQAIEKRIMDLEAVNLANKITMTRLDHDIQDSRSRADTQNASLLSTLGLINTSLGNLTNQIAAMPAPHQQQASAPQVIAPAERIKFADPTPFNGSDKDKL